MKGPLEWNTIPWIPCFQVTNVQILNGAIFVAVWQFTTSTYIVTSKQLAGGAGDYEIRY